MESREELLNRISQSLREMEQKGYKDTKWYKQLEEKYNAILNGAEYRVVDVTKECIASMGALMCSNNVWMGGRFYPTEKLVKETENAVSKFNY